MKQKLKKRVNAQRLAFAKNFFRRSRFRQCCVSSLTGTTARQTTPSQLTCTSVDVLAGAMYKRDDDEIRAPGFRQIPGAGATTFFNV